jgi:hypothetical protein
MQYPRGVRDKKLCSTRIVEPAAQIQILMMMIQIIIVAVAVVVVTTPAR